MTATDEQAPVEETRPRRWLTRGVVSVGAASFFSDAGHEITTAVLPSFLTVTLRASAGALGVIEGISDALVGVMKLLGGSLANDETRRFRLASGGYVVTAVATSAVGLTTGVWQAGALRALAWAARGIRAPARDALLASIAPREAYGRAFGLERAGDNLGAVVGPLLAALLVGLIGIRTTMLLAIVPGGFAAAAITFAAAEARRAGATSRRRARLELRALRGTGIGRPLVPIVCFEFGNCATTLLILRATHLLEHGGRSLTAATSVAVLIYAAHDWQQRPRVILRLCAIGVVVFVVVVADVFEVDRGLADGVPGVPGDLQDHEGDRQADDRVGDLSTERDHDRTRDDTQRDEAVNARMVSVRCHRRARESFARVQAHLRRYLVPDETDHTGCGERPEMSQMLGVNEPQDGLVEGDTGGDEDRQHDRQAGDLLTADAAEEEGDPERDRGQCVAEVVDQVREQRDRAGEREDRKLDPGRDPEHSEADRDCLHTLARADDRAVNQAMRVAVTVVGVVAIVGGVLCDRLDTHALISERSG